MDRVRQVKINFNKPELAGYPCGYIGENQAAELLLVPPMGLLQQADYYYLRFSEAENEETFQSSERLVLGENERALHMLIGNDLSQHEKLQAQLVAYKNSAEGDDDYIGKSAVVVLTFCPSIGGNLVDASGNGIEREVHENTLARHTHENKAVLDELGDDAGTLTYKGEEIKGGSAVSGKSPYISESGTWMAYDDAEGEWKDTGVAAEGDPGPGVASGGTTGQILTKQSDTDYDTAWQNAPATGVQPKQIVLNVDNGEAIVTVGQNDFMVQVPISAFGINLTMQDLQADIEAAIRELRKVCILRAIYYIHIPNMATVPADLQHLQSLFAHGYTGIAVENKNLIYTSQGDGNIREINGEPYLDLFFGDQLDDATMETFGMGLNFMKYISITAYTDLNEPNPPSIG